MFLTFDVYKTSNMHLTHNLCRSSNFSLLKEEDVYDTPRSFAGSKTPTDYLQDEEQIYNTPKSLLKSYDPIQVDDVDAVYDVPVNRTNADQEALYDVPANRKVFAKS